MPDPPLSEVGTSYFGVRDPGSAKRDLDRFAEAGLNAVLHTFSERDEQFYAGTMQEIVTASHERGLKVYMNPWGVGNVFGGEALSSFISHHPESNQKLSTDKRVPAACFNAPDFRRYMKEWILSASNTGADVLFLDEPHWFDPRFRSQDLDRTAWVCRCVHCRKRYEEQHGQPMPEQLTDRVRAFRTDALIDFIGTMAEIGADTGMKNAVCVAPDSSGGDTALDLDELGSLEHLDVIGATPFWDLHDEDPEAFVGTWTDAINRTAAEYDLESQIWIQGFKLDDSPETLNNLRTAIRTARVGKTDSLFLWGWDGCRIMSALACESPESIWKTYLEEIDQSLDSHTT